MNKLIGLCLFLGLILLTYGTIHVEAVESSGFTLEIPETVTVIGPKITLKDLAVTGPAEAFDCLKRVDLGSAPLPGEVRNFSREYLSFILKQYHFPQKINLKMGEQVNVKVQATCIKKAAIEKAIQDLITPANPNITKKWVELRNLPQEVWLTQGDWKIEVYPVGNLPEVGSALFKVVLVNESQNKTINVSGIIRALALVYRATRNISNKAEIQPADFEMIEVELINGKELVGKIPVQYRTTRLIKQGEILRSDQIQPIPLVGKDHEIKVIIRDENIEVNIIGVTKVDGWLGDEILIMNPISKKMFRGRVIGKGMAEVNLN